MTSREVSTRHARPRPGLPVRRNRAAPCLSLSAAFLATVATIVILPSGPCLAGPPPDLYELRRRYHEEVATAVGSTATGYVADLRDYEAERSAAGDYESALWAKLRAESIERSLAELANPPGSVVLAPVDAALSGQVTLDRSANLLRKWGSTGSRATWQVRQITPGRYRVLLSYGVAPPDEDAAPNGGSAPAAGGTVRVRNASALAAADTETLEATLSDTGGWEYFEDLELGVLEIRSNSASISIEAEKPNPLGLMCLRRLTLQPVEAARGPAEPVPPTAPAAVPEDLLSLGRRYAGRLAERLDAARSAYRTDLAALQAEAPDLADGIDAARAAALAFPPLEPLPFPLDAPPVAEGSSSTRPPDADRQLLPALDRIVAIRSAGITENTAQDFVTRLRNGSAIEWDTQRGAVTPGFYEVLLRARVTSSSGGEFEIATGAQKVSGIVARPARSPQSDAFDDIPAGAVRLGPDTPKIRLTVNRLSGDATTLCDLRGLVLRAINEDEARRLARAAALAQPAESAPSANGTEPSGASPSRPASPAEADDGFTRLEGCTLVRKATGRADSFWVRHEARELHVRLYGVTSPRADYGEDADALSSHRDLFASGGVEPDRRDLERYGARALRQLESLLEQGPFTVHTRNDDAGGGRIHAWVTAGDQGQLVQAALLESGLAAAEGEFARLPAAVRPDTDQEGAKEWLKEIQDAARKSGRGIW